MFGFYRLAAAVPKLKVADAAFNTEELRRCFRQAAENGADAVVFPELCVTGYSCGDLFFQAGPPRRGGGRAGHSARGCRSGPQ